MSQINAPQNSRQTKGNANSDFQHPASIVSERLDNIQIDASNTYLRVETKEECQVRKLKICIQTNGQLSKVN